jgi:hypothetical protein
VKDPDQPRTYHRRIREPNSKGDVPTLCGRLVNYQQSMQSLDDVDCGACIATADVLVKNFVGGVEQVLEPALAKLRRSQGS